mgnify:CR=1 FL=1
MLNEFKAFIARGNVLDLAVGFIMGAAFTAVVDSLVKDILMPPLGMLIGGVDFRQLVFDLSAGGYTDLGAALRLLREALGPSRMEERALPPALVLVSDGMPTDDFRHELDLLLTEPWGARSVRAAVGIARPR